jgi:Arc/MetJ-type ribon-helix-helix transcriptional regulator
LPRKLEEPRLFTVLLDKKDLELLEALARERGVSKAEVIRIAIRLLAQQAKELGYQPPAPDPDDPPSDDPYVGVTRRVPTGKVQENIERYVHDELARAKARAILNGILELRSALQSPDARLRANELRARLRELREQYRELAREVRAQSVLRPLGEELVMLSEELGVPIFEERRRR